MERIMGTGWNYKSPTGPAGGCVRVCVCSMADGHWSLAEASASPGQGRSRQRGAIERRPRSAVPLSSRSPSAVCQLSSHRNATAMAQRRSIIPLQQPQETSQVTVEANVLNDARQKRRDRIHSRRSLGETPAVRTVGNQATSVKSRQELREHYMACMKLAQCNKIDTRNAFGLNLIDGLSDLIKNSEEMNFGLATTALDAGTKIYVNRVDCVYSDAQKVSNGLVQTMQEKGKGRAQDEDGEDEEMEQMNGQNGVEDEDNPNLAAKKKKKAPVRRTGKTLASSIATLDIDKITTNAEVDPLFHKINTSHDIGNVNSMFLANLDLDITGALILDINSKTELLSSRDGLPTPSQTVVPRGDLCCKFRSVSQNPGRIFCEKFFLTFTFNRNSNLEMTDLETTGRFEDGLTQPHSSKYAFDLNAEPVDDEDSPPPGFNLSRDDGFDPMSDDEGSVGDAVENQVMNRSIITAVNVDSLGDLKSLLSGSGEYSYFKNAVVGSWAGPTHWKPNVWFKLKQRQEQRQVDPNDPNAASSKRRKKKTYEPVDFITCEPVSLSSSTRRQTLNITTLNNWSKASENLLLPQYIDFNPKILLRPNIKANIFYKIVDKGSTNPSSQASQATEPPDDHSMSGISSPPPDGGFDVGDEMNFPAESQPITEGFLPSQATATETGFTGTNLIDAPDPLNQIVLPFAKHAKRMDVKRLKKSMLELIRTPDSLNNSLIAPQEPVQLNNSIQFKELYSQLPSKIPTSMAKDMSPQIAFVTLLHLANENVSMSAPPMNRSNRLSSLHRISYYKV